MAIKSIGANTEVGVGHLAIDTAADLADLPDYAKSNNLKMGTDVICIGNGRVYMMDSEYTFREI